MLNDNIKNLRKSRGISQEELAIRLGVVRQTVSKWEKGLSVPDSEMLMKIAEVFEVSVGILLGGEIPQTEAVNNEIADQLQRINEQLAIRNRRSRNIIKIVVGLIVGIIVVNLLMIVLGSAVYRNVKTETEAFHTEIQAE